MTDLTEKSGSWMNCSTAIFEQTNDEVDRNIQFLVRAISADFMHKFTSHFTSEQSIRDYKRRLRSLFEKYDAKLVYEAYEEYLDGNPEWPPTNANLRAALEKADDRNKRAEKNREEAKRVAAIPRPTVSVDPLKLLADAKAKARPKNDSHEAWLKRKAEKLQNHEAVLVLHGDRISKPEIWQDKTCSVDFCATPGVFSTSVRGGENWYCREHFKAKV